MITRLLMGAFGVAHWQKAVKDIDTTEEEKNAVTKDIAYQLESPHIIIMISLLLIGVILNVMS